MNHAMIPVDLLSALKQNKMAKGFLLAVVAILILSGILWVAYTTGKIAARKSRKVLMRDVLTKKPDDHASSN